MGWGGTSQGLGGVFDGHCDSTRTSLLCNGASREDGERLFGKWKGQLGAGAAELRIVLTIEKVADGEFSAQLVSKSLTAERPLPPSGF